jgi:hypothetical protein
MCESGERSHAEARPGTAGAGGGATSSEEVQVELLAVACTYETKHWHWSLRVRECVIATRDTATTIRHRGRNELECWLQEGGRRGWGRA